MATNFPNTLDSFTNPTSSNYLNSPSHAAQHANINDAMLAVQTKMAIDSAGAYAPGGAGTTTIDVTAARINLVTMPAATQTLAISNAVVGRCFIIEIANVTSQGALTWFSTIKWAGGTAPTLTGVNGKKDSFGFRCTSTGNYDGYVIGQNL